jgi:hypothetical protein
MAPPSIDDYAGYTKNELADLCRANGVSGHSKKPPSVLIDMLIRANVHPVRKNVTSKKGSSGGSVTTKAPEVPTEESATKSEEAEDTASTSSTSSHEYIFRASWSEVLQHLEKGSAQVVIADTPISTDDAWITESLRVLEDDGTLVIRGLHPQAVPSFLQNSQWITVGSESLLCVTKGSALPSGAKSVTTFYESLISNTRPDATILVPFAGNGDICKLIHKHRRSFVTMDSDEDCVSRLYKIVHS